jgi:hypothetical protein
MKRLIWASALCLALGATWVVRAAPQLAAPQIEADPNQDYKVTPEAGPWMICAAYFNGPPAPDLAHQMVQQIRSRYNLPAFVFNYADEERKKQKAILDQQHIPFPEPAAPGEDVVPVPHRRITIRVEEQCAVMIGGYPDENAAHTALLGVKKLKSPELKVPDGFQPFGSVIDYQGKESQINPFATQSMVVRNPTVPHDSQTVSKTKDPFLKTLNADEDYSMLRCSGKYTLVVKEYLAAQMIQNQQTESSNFLKMLSTNTSHAGESLNVAAANAHELARVLHQLKFDAYVLHTRTSSVVSVGGFNSPDDPAVEGLKSQIAALRQRMTGGQNDASKKDPLGLYSTPVPIEVPRP